MNRNDIKKRLMINDIPFKNNLPERLEIYLSLIKEWNQKMDLTSVTDDDETIDRHFIDSLSILKSDLIPEEASFIDIGTGAGFPGLVLALARDDLQITLIDAQMKRLSFLESVIRATGRGNIRLVHARAEDGARNPEMREKYDIAAARALAPLNVLCEYLLPYVRPEGYALCWKGPALKDEMESGRKAADILGGRTELPFKYDIFGRQWEHVILPVKKIEHTLPLYPRKAGIPKQKPLGV